MDYWFLLRVYRNYKPAYLDIPFGTFHNYNNKSSDIETVRNSLKQVRDQFLVQHPWEGSEISKTALSNGGPIHEDPVRLP